MATRRASRPPRALRCKRPDRGRLWGRLITSMDRGESGHVETDLERWVSFRVGATLLTLRPRGPWIVCDDGKSMPGSAGIQLAFRVPPPAVDACHAELVAKGVPILRGPSDLPDWRHRTLFFRDPEENIIDIYAEY